MLELFPELKDFSDLHFREPTKKTKSRFKYSQFRPDPLEQRMRARTLVRERIRRNVLLVADNSLRLVPVLSLRFVELDEQRSQAKREVNRRLYLRMGSIIKTQDLSEARLALMKDLVNPTSSSCLPKKRGTNGMKVLARHP